MTGQAKWTEILLLGDVPWFTFQTKGEKNQGTSLIKTHHFITNTIF